LALGTTVKTVTRRPSLPLFFFIPRRGARRDRNDPQHVVVEERSHGNDGLSGNGRRGLGRAAWLLPPSPPWTAGRDGGNQKWDAFVH